MFKKVFHCYNSEMTQRSQEERTAQFQTFLPCLYVADPATFLASNSALEALFPPQDSLFIQLLKEKKSFVLLPVVKCKPSAPVTRM